MKTTIQYVFGRKSSEISGLTTIMVTVTMISNAINTSSKPISNMLLTVQVIQIKV